MNPRPEIYRTGYDRSAARIGIVHLGCGAFHRSHQAVYVDDCMEATGDLRWGIAAVNLRAADGASFARARAAGEGYLLKTHAPDGVANFRLVRSLLAFADWSRDAEEAEALLALESVHAATVTVTEGGYCLGVGGRLDLSHPAIAKELAGGGESSVYAYLGRALARRVEAAAGPISILSCDNIRANGRLFERAFLDWLELAGRSELAGWVRENAAFPCSMVDCITPCGCETLASEARALLPGVESAPVHSESFRQWAIENRLAGPFPRLEECGVQIVEDVAPYEEAKVRILNGGHAGLAYLGALAGYATFDQVIRDPLLRRHLDGWVGEEVLPGLDMALPFDKRAYWEGVAARFGNRGIADQLERICMDGWSKMPIFVQPTLASCLEQGIRPRFGYDCVASWYVFARRCGQGRSRIAYRESRMEALEPLLAPGREEEFARTEELWGRLPESHGAFVADVVSSVNRMEARWRD